MSTRSVLILKGRGRIPIEAVVDDEPSTIRFVEAEEMWSPFRFEALKRAYQAEELSLVPQHVHWNWALKAVQLTKIYHQGLLLECEGDIQGLVLLTTAGRTSRCSGSSGKPLLYIEYLEVAPWNSREFTEDPRYFGVGTRLIQAAVAQSLEEEFRGRIGLHSLPQSDPFYSDRMGMQSFGPDPDYDDLVYFELAEDKVASLLER